MWRPIATDEWNDVTPLVDACQVDRRQSIDDDACQDHDDDRCAPLGAALLASSRTAVFTHYLQPIATFNRMRAMLRKRRKEDGGMDVETALLGPAVFLDVWAVRDLSGEASIDLRNRFAMALTATDASLLVSSAWFTELETLQGDARTRAQALFTSLGENWLLINPIVSAVAAREARNELGAYLSYPSLDAYVRDRCGELLRADKNPHDLSDAEFFDLGRPLAWTANDADAATTAARQSQALKDAAKTRAHTDRDEQRRDRNAHIRLYLPVPFASGRMACAHNAAWREVTRRSLGRTWMPNDGFDIAHLVPAMTIGGLIAVDSDWKDIGQAAAGDLPRGHVRLYRPGELEQLIETLEMLTSRTPR